MLYSMNKAMSEISYCCHYFLSNPCYSVHGHHGRGGWGGRIPPPPFHDAHACHTFPKMDWTYWPWRFLMLALASMFPRPHTLWFLSLGFCKTASVSAHLTTFHRGSSCPHQRGHCTSGWSNAIMCMAGNWIQNWCVLCDTGSSHWEFVIYIQLCWKKCKIMFYDEYFPLSKIWFEIIT